MKKLVILSAVLALGACADVNKSVTETVNSDVTGASLQSSTAAYFATSKRNVRVGNVSQNVFGTAYQSRVAGTLYDCNYFRGTVTCNRAR